MSNTFEHYDDEFNSLLQQIETSLRNSNSNNNSTNNDVESGSKQQQYTESLLTQCEDLIKQMAIEARSVSDSKIKRDLLSQVKMCKSKYQALQQESDRIGILMSAAGANDNINNNSQLHASQKERLLLQQNEESVANQNETLERARRTMQETEAVALEIQTELGQNREKLQSAHGRIREMGGLTGRARRILTSMNQRAVQQKMILYGVAIGLGLAFLFMLLMFWRS